MCIGRGVFASKDIPGRSVLEVCPVLVLDPVENGRPFKAPLFIGIYIDIFRPTYQEHSSVQLHLVCIHHMMTLFGLKKLSSCSNWPYTPSVEEKAKANGVKPPTMTQAVILGLGSMFNHSNLYQNVGWERDLDKQLITYTALRDIKAGEELCISYGQRLTFKDTEEEQLPNGPEDWTEVLNIIDLID